MTEWEDEEELEPEPEPTHGTAPKLSSAKAAKAQDAAQARRQLAIESALEEGESDADRARRLQQEVEDADAELAAELYAGAAEEKVKVVAGLDGYALKSLKDHVVRASCSSRAAGYLPSLTSTCCPPGLSSGEHTGTGSGCRRAHGKGQVQAQLPEQARARGTEISTKAKEWISGTWTEAVASKRKGTKSWKMHKAQWSARE